MSQPTDISDRPTDDYGLMRAIVAGDRAAFKALYDRHAGSVYALGVRMLKDPGEAEQLLTDVFFEVWHARERYDEVRAQPLTYLMRITRSRAIDKLRRKGPVGMNAGVSLDPAAGIDVAIDNAPSLPAEVDEHRQLVVRALGALDVEQRRAIECAYYDGLSHAEIARKLNRPLGTVKSNIRTGMVRLREILSQFPESGATLS